MDMTDEQLARIEADPNALDDVLKEAFPDESEQVEEPAATGGDKETETEDETEVEVEVEKAETEIKEEEPAPVLARDGKHTIPFDVLDRARKENKTLNETLASTQARLKELETQIQTGTKADDGGSSDILAEIEKMQKDLEDSELPEVATAIGKMGSVVRSLQGKVNQLESAYVERTKVEAAQAKRTVAEAESGNATLVLWKGHADPKFYDQAAEYDAMLRGNPDFKDLSLDQRFAKAVELTLAMYPTAPKPTPVTQASSETTTAAPVKKVKEAPPVYSLTDVAGGMAPAKTEQQAIDDMTTAELSVMVEKMKTPEQIMEWLAQTHG